MKKHLLLIIAAFSFLGTFAQTISVKSFQALPTDMTAGSLEGKRIDQNNEVCALIKIVTTQTGFIFEAGALGIVDTQQEAGEVWVWVPRGSRKITIKHPQLGVLREYRYPVEIQSERTYEMVLVTGTVETIVKEEVQEQYLMFEVVPAEAILEVNDQMWSVSAEGTARKMVAFGTYTYRAQAPNYHPEAGNVTVNDPDNTKKVKIVLKPNFGWVEVPGTGVLKDAVVYIDNALIGKAPCKSEALKSGTHNIKIQKNLYVSYNATVTVNDNETTTVSPNLTADFARITLQVDADAEIWVNDEKKGTRSWTGELESGTYKIECKLANHEPSTVRKEITNQMNGEVIRLDAPRPIYGSLNVESTPDMAILYIDGKEIGETPKFIKEILIGQHEIKLVKNNYRNYTETITVRKGERTQVEATMDNVTYEQLAKQGDEYYQAKNYAEALKCFQEAAEHGDAYAQLCLGSLYYKGHGVTKDFTEAIKWWQNAADQGNAIAIRNIGEMYADGQGVAKDIDKAIKLMIQAGELGDYRAYRNLGNNYRFGWHGFPKDEAKSKSWFKKAVETTRSFADKGDAEAQYWMGQYYSSGTGFNKDWSEAVKWFRKAEEQGHVFARRYLGYCYCLGLGVTKNEAKAEELFRKGNDEERANAYCLVGQGYSFGFDITKDYQKAMLWYSKAADLGSADAYYQIASFYHWGNGVTKDAIKAEKLYLKAVDYDSNSPATFSLGMLYQDGEEGVSQDYTKAMYWYRKNADGGSYVGQYKVGEMYENGEGVAKNITEAKKWYKIAADQGYKDAIDALKRLQ